jgi:hypothetical protein
LIHQRRIEWRGFWQGENIASFWDSVITTLTSPPSIWRTEGIILVFGEFPFLRRSMVDSSFLRIWFCISSGVRSVLVELMVPIDEEWSQNELDCSVVVRGSAYLVPEIFHSIEIGNLCVWDPDVSTWLILESSNDFECD